MPCVITPSDFAGLIFGNCHYCGCAPLNLTKLRVGKNLAYNGIDRIDNALPYQPGNVVSCCKTCNSMKSKLPKSAFLNHVGKIFQHNRTEDRDYSGDDEGVESHRGMTTF